MVGSRKADSRKLGRDPGKEKSREKEETKVIKTQYEYIGTNSPR